MFVLLQLIRRALTEGSPAGFAAGVAATLSAIIGVYIGYHAFRGLRRHGEPSMRYLSFGMVILFGVTYVVALFGQGLILFEVVPVYYQSGIRLLVRLLQLTGLGCIAYSMRLAVR